jgi:subtilisin family serine protease
MKKLLSFLSVAAFITLFFINSSYGAIATDPGSFNIVTKEGCVVERTLSIQNTGATNVNYMIRTRSGHNTESQRILEGSNSENSIISSTPRNYNFSLIENAPYKTGELIVRFGNKGTGRQIESSKKVQMMSRFGGASVKREFELVPGLTVVKLQAGVSVEEALKQFNQSEDVIYAQPNYEVHALATIPNDSLFNELWGMNNLSDNDIDAPEAWDITTGNEDIVVAVIDTGVDYTHPDLAANMWVNQAEKNGLPGVDDDENGYVDDIYGYDFVNNDGDPRDDHYHGTHCAGTIGAIGNNGQGVAGVCWHVKIMALKFLNAAGSGSTEDAIQAVQYSVLMGAKLSSNSWGGGGYSQALKDAIDAAGAAGMLFVAAAGNDGSNNDSYPTYPCSYTCESIISVMATDSSDDKSSFSNYGLTSVDIGAPGSSIMSCKPGNAYQYLSGTSMATPHVAGACALVWSMNSALSNMEVKNILLQTADKKLVGQCVSGGRLNIYNAILETRSPWITVEPDNGNVQPGETDEVQISFDATKLQPGIYHAEILILSDDPQSPVTIPVTMAINPDDLQVSPSEGFESSGIEGGPFTPSNKIYRLTNIGTESLNWKTIMNERWICSEPNQGVLGPAEYIDVNVSISSSAEILEPNIYKTNFQMQNLSSGAEKTRPVTFTVKPPDYLSEEFEGKNDLQNKTISFMPDGSKAYYEACNKKITEFPINPAGSISVTVADDDFAEVVLNDSKKILFYGTYYDRFYIGSNGYITFEIPDTNYTGDTASHFELPRISGIFTDLTPTNSQNISYKQLDDEIVVTFRNIPVFGDKTKTCSFQIEMFFVNGEINISYLDINASNFTTGLSRGRGLPPFYLQSDLSKYPICWLSDDFDRDYIVNFKDFAVLTSHWLDSDCNIPYWCGKSDLDYSGKTDINDLAYFALDWLEIKNSWMQPDSYWKFDEGSGGIAYDSGPGRNDGTIYGAQWSQGQVNGALDFDGVDDYIDCGPNLNLQGDKITASAWIKSQATGTDNQMHRIVGRWKSGYEAFNLFYDGRTTIKGFYFEVKTTSGAKSAAFREAIIADKWYLVTGVYDGTNIKIYINGVEKGTTLQSGNLNSSIGNTLIGKDEAPTWNSCFNGLIDDVRIYGIALSANEVQQLYNNTRTQKATIPIPENGAINISTTQDLSWTADPCATSHAVYFGTTNPPQFAANQTETTFDTGTMECDSTYYWRIDEINLNGIVTGDVWSFTTVPGKPEPAINPIPEDETVEIGLTQDLSWTAGEGAASHDVYFGTENPPPFAGNQMGTTFDTGVMSAFTTYYWRVDEKNVGGTTTGTVWSFTTECEVPGAVTNPIPASGSVDLDPNNNVLSWSAGLYSDSYDVYFGTSYAAVLRANMLSPEYKGNYYTTSFDPCDLDVNTTYYWRIDGTNNCYVVKGGVWNFKTSHEVFDPNFIGWWKLDEGSGTVVHDSARTNNGTISEAIWATGKIGAALEFDGINDHVNCGGPDLDGMKSLTLSAWIYGHQWRTGGGSWILAKRNTSGFSYDLVVDNSSGSPDIAVGFYCDGVSAALHSPKNLINLNNWYHIVATNSGSVQKIYINGNAVASSNVNTGPIRNTSANFWIGQITDAYYPSAFDGLIDDVRIYERAITDSEVLRLYNEGLNP